ncbi:MAG: Rrf2 family transcriptional regulator [Calditrichaeota bacterium]|nr:MAG: Rrf2 family transcriptional regulator [Calditrichota bacterium]MBL1207529.1 Rrf2 family transcriptional regulator [Calditrichota bacterium]NOG47361.1 Rrf2 family transcriptional regulator [Calditrichota bacterium]
MLSKSCEYAIRSVLCVASHQHSYPDKSIGIKQISDSLQIPVHFLGKVMQNLTRQQILQSAKGKNGGFFLTPKQLDTPIMRIVEVVDSSLYFNRCGLGLEKCSDEHPCALHNDFAVFRDGFAKALRTHTISSMTIAHQKGDIHLVSL